MDCRYQSEVREFVDRVNVMLFFVVGDLIT